MDENGKNMNPHSPSEDYTLSAPPQEAMSTEEPPATTHPIELQTTPPVESVPHPTNTFAGLVDRLKQERQTKSAGARRNLPDAAYEMTTKKVPRPATADAATHHGIRNRPGFFRRQQSTLSTKSSSAKEMMMKETKKFFGLDDCEKQALLWEERRRRHASRSNGPLKEEFATRPKGISRQVSQAQPRAAFREAARAVQGTPTSQRSPAILSVLQEAQLKSVSPLASKNVLGLKVDVDSAQPTTEGVDTPVSYVEVPVEEDEDEFDSVGSLVPTSGGIPEEPREPKRDSVAKIAWDGLAFAAKKVVKTPRDVPTPYPPTQSSSASRTRGLIRTVRDEQSGPIAYPISQSQPLPEPPPARPLLSRYTEVRQDVDTVPVTLDPKESRLKRLKKRFEAKVFDSGMYHEDGILDHVIGERYDDKCDYLSDYRPYFTWWITTVQIVITLLIFFSYDQAPFKFSLSTKSGMVLMTSLSIQNVQYWEASNFWVGPSPADLIRLGAKYTPCMRRDDKIEERIEELREIERDTGCCIRNDNSGCAQTLPEQCSPRLSLWKNKTSGTRVTCGQDPRFCKVPASVAPFQWSEDDITKWPICKETLEDKARSSNHMTCEIIGRPCCIGIHGECRIVSQEYCSFVKGTFHEEATLCSQVSCLNELCGLIPFYNPANPDQIYRLVLSLFIHAGVIHMFITFVLQFLFMRDLEKLVGPVRIGIVYIVSGIAGNLASAIFEPHKPEVGPGGAHFGLLACLFVELKNNWFCLVSPKKSLLRLSVVTTFLFLLGFLPWVDCWAHLAGFICGGLLSFALFPFVYQHKGQHAVAWKICRIITCLFSVVVIIVVLFILFYVTPVHDCTFCDLLNCIPFTKDFCAEQKINYNKELDIL